MKHFPFSYLIIFVVLLGTSCSKKQSAETDDPYDYREYISHHSQSALSVAEPLQIQLSQALEGFEEEQELDSRILKISPKVKGKLTIKNQRELLFIPEKNWEPETEYTAQLNLSQLYDEVDAELKTYTFKFKTRSQNFKINLGNLQSRSKTNMYFEGSLEASDYIAADKLPGLIKVEQSGKSLPVTWKDPENEISHFRFTVDSIERGEKESKLQISWDGKAIKSSNKGTDELPIPGKDVFKILSLNTKNAPNSSLSINFSDPLDPDQDFSGLVKIEKAKNLTYETDGNTLYVYPSEQISGDLKVDLFSGIKNTEGKKLTDDFSDKVRFEPIKPGVELISKGVILPNSESVPLYFKTVNLKAVDIRVIKIYENNLLEFLQNGNLNSTSSYYLRRVGKLIAKKTIPLEIETQEKDSWKAHALKLSEFFEADPGALYQIEFSFKQNYSLYTCENEEESLQEDITVASEEEDIEREKSYWNNEVYNLRDPIYDWENQDDPCYEAYYQSHNFTSTNLLGSNLGLIVKKGSDNSYNFFVTDLLSTQPENSTKIELFDYQKQLVETLNTNQDGKATYTGDEKIAFVIAEKNKDFAYADLDAGKSLSMSKFDVSGNKLEKGLKGFIYTDRGVHRPGDTIHLTFALNDNGNPLPEEIPVKLEVRNAYGKLIQRKVISEGEESSMAKALNRFYYFKIPTKSSDATGNWEAQISAGGAYFNKNLNVGSIKPNRLKIRLDFDDKVLSSQKPISGLLTGSWLHGAPARNLAAEMDVRLTKNSDAFDKYPNYNFDDPVRDFDETELSLLKTTLDPEGTTRFSKKIDLSEKAPGMLKASFLTRILEGGGDFSLDVFSMNLATYPYFIGLKTPDPHRYGSLYTDENNRFEVITLDPEGKISPRQKLTVQVFKIEWKWWWNRGEDRLSSYEDASVHKVYKELDITTDEKGKADFDLTIPDEDRGRYLIRVKDSNGGHATGETLYFYKNWTENLDDINAEDAKMLVFSADKNSYKVGETAKINFPSGNEGRALISIENGTKVLSSQWVETEKGETKIEIPLTSEMAPNIFVNISLLQKHDQVKNDLPIRLYGVIPIKVEDSNTLLEPQLQMPDELKPETNFTIKVSEKNQKAMTYTLAVVDEGLLDLTRFPTPDIHQSFYRHEALGVKTFDLYDYVIGAYSGSISNIYEIGGDDAAEQGKMNKANRFKPVVDYLGPFELKAGETKTHQVYMPNYIGSVRTMLIAGDAKKGAYGNTEKTTPVKKPLMVLASVPRKLSPGEEVSIPVTVFAMEDRIKNVTVKLATGEAFEAVNGNTQNLHFDGPGDDIVNFNYKIKPTDKVQKIRVEVSGHGETAFYETEIAVENPNPYAQKTTQYEVGKNQEKEIEIDSYGESGTRSARIEIASIPPIDFTKRLQFLIQSPYGSVESLAASGFPQLYMDEIIDLVNQDKAAAEKNLKNIIERIGEAQLSSGALPVWDGSKKANTNTTNSSGHFMLEAKEKGFALPIGFLDNWIAYQRQEAKNWNIHDYAYNTSPEQAYRLYTLALAGQPDLAAMNRLRESKHLTNEGKWRLAAAYALAGKNQVANQIAESARINPPKDDENYHSSFGNKVLAFETLVLLDSDKQKELAESIARDLSSKKWLGSEEIGLGLLAMTKMLRKSGGKDLDFTFTKNGEAEEIKTTHPLVIRDLEADQSTHHLKIKNKRDNIVYVSIFQEGKPGIGEEVPESNNLRIQTQYLNAEEKPIDIAQIRQGTEIRAQISITNTSSSDVEDLAMNQTFPGGWEIINTRFADSIQSSLSDADYSDIRDDRINFYFDLKAGETKTFKVKLNASYLGKYYLPSTFVRALHDPLFYATTKGKWTEIHQ